MSTETPQRVDFIGVGANKCGTTWIYKCLEEHPEICMGRPKEIHFFNVNDPLGKDNDKYSRGLEYYFSHFSHCDSSKYVGEVGPKYLADPDAPHLIKKHFPNAKLFVSIRDPIDRAFSGYNHQASKYGDERPFQSFQDAIADQDWLDRHIRYYEELKRYFDLFPRENIYVGIYEDLKEDPKSFIQDLYRFLGVDSTFVPPSVDIRYNATAQRFASKNRSIKKTVFKIYRNLKTIPGLLWLLQLAKRKGVHSKALKQIDRHTIPTESTPHMDEETRRKLQKLVSEEVERVESLIGRPIPAWHHRSE